MTTDQNTDFTETGDQISQGEEQLSQEIERNDGTPSWGEQEQEESFEDQPEADEVSTQGEIPSEIDETPENDSTEETTEETLPENPRRVLSFNDYFTNQN